MNEWISGWISEKMNEPVTDKRMREEKKEGTN